MIQAKYSFKDNLQDFIQACLDAGFKKPELNAQEDGFLCEQHTNLYEGWLAGREYASKIKNGQQQKP